MLCVSHSFYLINELKEEIIFFKLSEEPCDFFRENLYLKESIQKLTNSNIKSQKLSICIQEIAKKEINDALNKISYSALRCMH